MFQDGSDGSPIYSLQSRVPRSEFMTDALCAGTAPFANDRQACRRDAVRRGTSPSDGLPRRPLAARQSVAACSRGEVHRSRSKRDARAALRSATDARPIRSAESPRPDLRGPIRFFPRRFHVLLNPLFKVLFNFPSLYLFAIGLVVIFSLGWSLPPA